ncbi:MAG: N(1)-aminopropylagmatine ureohydrolase [Promethearchaeota archaeon]|nr:MAG: N(1)-aminopropylagmatine ureohydrolase [Candidatus Lokiarchaeota archaeon]
MTFFDFGEVIKKDTEYVFFGIPWDYLTSIDLPNSAIAPNKIRKVTKDLALTTELGDKIPNFKLVDVGDIKVENQEVEENIKTIGDFINNIYNQNENIIPIMLGGDHFCSFPVIKSIGERSQQNKNLGVLIFDAHLDFYQHWDKGIYSHATISHRVFDLDFINNKNLLIAGTRDIDIPELQIAKEKQISHFDAYLISEIGIEKYTEKIIDFFKKSNINRLYISIDVDAFDPSIAPATGFAIPGGFSYREMWKILRKVVKNFNLIGLDLVEVAPNLDLKNHITSSLAAKLITEVISFIERTKMI